MVDSTTLHEANLEAIVIGASAGGVEALSLLLPALARGYRLPVFVVTHLPRDRPSLLAGIFGAQCEVEVKEAFDKEPIVPGTVYFAPPDYHLLVDSREQLSLSVDEPVWFCRPAIDVLFESAAAVYGRGLAAVVLTGNNEDGAAGLAAVHAAGGVALVQDPREARAPVMPQAALRRVPEARALPLPHLAQWMAAAGQGEAHA